MVTTVQSPNSDDESFIFIIESLWVKGLALKHYPSFTTFGSPKTNPSWGAPALRIFSCQNGDLCAKCTFQVSLWYHWITGMTADEHEQKGRNSLAGDSATTNYQSLFLFSSQASCCRDPGPYRSWSVIQPLVWQSCWWALSNSAGRASTHRYMFNQMLNKEIMQPAWTR